MRKKKIIKNSPKKKRFNPICIPTNSSFLNISNTDANSLAFMKRFDQLQNLNATNTLISDLKGVQISESIVDIQISGSPLAENDYYRIMLLIGLSPQLQSIDNREVTQIEREIAHTIQNLTLLLIYQGYIIDDLDPLKLYTTSSNFQSNDLNSQSNNRKEIIIQTDQIIIGPKKSLSEIKAQQTFAMIEDLSKEIQKTANDMNIQPIQKNQVGDLLNQIKKDNASTKRTKNIVKKGKKGSTLNMKQRNVDNDDIHENNEVQINQDAQEKIMNYQAYAELIKKANIKRKEEKEKQEILLMKEAEEQEAEKLKKSQMWQSPRLSKSELKQRIKQVRSQNSSFLGNESKTDNKTDNNTISKTNNNNNTLKKSKSPANKSEKESKITTPRRAISPGIHEKTTMSKNLQTEKSPANEIHKAKLSSSKRALSTPKKSPIIGKSSPNTSRKDEAPNKESSKKTATPISKVNERNVKKTVVNQTSKKTEGNKMENPAIEKKSISRAQSQNKTSKSSKQEDIFPNNKNTPKQNPQDRKIISPKKNTQAPKQSSQLKQSSPPRQGSPPGQGSPQKQGSLQRPKLPIKSPISSSNRKLIDSNADDNEKNKSHMYNENEITLSNEEDIEFNKLTKCNTDEAHLDEIFEESNQNGCLQPKKVLKKKVIKKIVKKKNQTRKNDPKSQTIEAIPQNYQEKKQLEREQLEREQLEKEQKEREQLEKEQKEREQLEKEQRDREQLEKEQLEREQLEKEQRDREQLEKEQLEKEQLEKEQLEKEQLEKEQRDREQLEKEQLEREQLEKEPKEREQLEKEPKEREQLEKEQGKGEREILELGLHDNTIDSIHDKISEEENVSLIQICGVTLKKPTKKNVIEQINIESQDQQCHFSNNIIDYHENKSESSEEEELYTSHKTYSSPKPMDKISDSSSTPPSNRMVHKYLNEYQDDDKKYESDFVWTKVSTPIKSIMKTSKTPERAPQRSVRFNTTTFDSACTSIHNSSINNYNLDNSIENIPPNKTYINDDVDEIQEIEREPGLEQEPELEQELKPMSKKKPNIDKIKQRLFKIRKRVSKKEIPKPNDIPKDSDLSNDDTHNIEPTRKGGDDDEDAEEDEAEREYQMWIKSQNMCVNNPLADETSNVDQNIKPMNEDSIKENLKNHEEEEDTKERADETIEDNIDENDHEKKDHQFFEEEEKGDQVESSVQEAYIQISEGSEVEYKYKVSSIINNKSIEDYDYYYEEDDSEQANKEYMSIIASIESSESSLSSDYQTAFESMTNDMNNLPIDDNVFQEVCRRSRRSSHSHSFSDSSSPKKDDITNISLSPINPPLNDNEDIFISNIESSNIQNTPETTKKINSSFKTPETPKVLSTPKMPNTSANLSNVSIVDQLVSNLSSLEDGSFNSSVSVNNSSSASPTKRSPMFEKLKAMREKNMNKKIESEKKRIEDRMRKIRESSEQKKNEVISSESFNSSDEHYINDSLPDQQISDTDDSKLTQIEKIRMKSRQRNERVLNGNSILSSSFGFHSPVSSSPSLESNNYSTEEKGLQSSLKLNNTSNNLSQEENDRFNDNNSSLERKENIDTPHNETDNIESIPITASSHEKNDSKNTIKKTSIPRKTKIPQPKPKAKKSFIPTRSTKLGNEKKPLNEYTNHNHLDTKSLPNDDKREIVGPEPKHKLTKNMTKKIQSKENHLSSKELIKQTFSYNDGDIHAILDDTSSSAEPNSPLSPKATNTKPHSVDELQSEDSGVLNSSIDEAIKELSSRQSMSPLRSSFIDSGVEDENLHYLQKLVNPFSVDPLRDLPPNIEGTDCNINDKVIINKPSENEGFNKENHLPEIDIVQLKSIQTKPSLSHVNHKPIKRQIKKKPGLNVKKQAKTNLEKQNVSSQSNNHQNVKNIAKDMHIEENEIINPIVDDNGLLYEDENLFQRQFALLNEEEEEEENDRIKNDNDLKSLNKNDNIKKDKPTTNANSVIHKKPVKKVVKRKRKIFVKEKKDHTIQHNQNFYENENELQLDETKDLIGDMFHMPTESAQIDEFLELEQFAKLDSNLASDSSSKVRSPESNLKKCSPIKPLQDVDINGIEPMSLMVSDSDGSPDKNYEVGKQQFSKSSYRNMLLKKAIQRNRQSPIIQKVDPLTDLSRNEDDYGENRKANKAPFDQNFVYTYDSDSTSEIFKNPPRNS